MFGLLTTSPTFDNANGLSSKDAANNSTTCVFTDGTQRSYNGGLTNNPYWQIKRNTFTNNSNRGSGKIGAFFDFTDDLTLVHRTGINAKSDLSSIGFDVNSAINPTRQFIQHQEEYFEISTDNLLSYNRRFGFDSNVYILLGHNYNYSNREIFRNTGQFFAEPSVFEMNNMNLITPFQNQFDKKTNRFIELMEKFMLLIME